MKAVGIIFANVHENNIPELVRVRTLASVPFGGRYRLIDFTLSNMVNSDINTVGIVTTNNYQSLMDHVGSGKDWDLARKDGGVIMLPPFNNGESVKMNDTRLSALQGIMNFLYRANADYVVMTDCDMVCRLDYSDVIEKHVASNADITMVYRKKTVDDAGENKAVILSLSGQRVAEIKYIEKLTEEANVFMNMYVMKKDFLIKLVLDSLSNNRHFTTDILASNVDNFKIMAYEYTGYYASINSLQAYYDSNLDLLNKENREELFGDRSVFTKIRDSAPTKFGDNCVIKNSFIADGCVIEGEVENSILFRGVKVAKGTVIRNSILMQQTVTGENVTLNCIIADKDVVVRDKVVLSGTKNHPFYIGKGELI